MIKKSNFVRQQGSLIVFFGKVLYSHNAFPHVPDIKLGDGWGGGGGETLQWSMS